MAAVIAFISQKGGVGKSTLARALAAVCAQAGLEVVLADLDPRQQTLIQWQKARTAQRVSPRLSVEPFDNAAEAVIERAEACDLLILDTPGGVNDDTLAVARTAHLIVQPTGPSLDDVHPTVLLFHELVAAGIPKSRLVAALCRVLDEEEADARAYLEEAGYEVLEGSIPESLTYRVAHNRGRSLTETNEQAFNERADALIEALLTKVAAITSIADEAEEPTRMPKGGAA